MWNSRQVHVRASHADLESRMRLTFLESISFQREEVEAGGKGKVRFGGGESLFQKQRSLDLETPGSLCGL